MHSRTLPIARRIGGIAHRPTQNLQSFHGRKSPKYESHWVQMFAGNWQASGIFTASSGSPLSIVDGADISLTGVGADRPDEIANPFVGGTVAANPTCVAPATVHTLQAWYNPCAFATEPLGTYGTLGRNSIPGPGNWNFDAAIWRIFPIKESVKLDFPCGGLQCL